MSEGSATVDHSGSEQDVSDVDQTPTSEPGITQVGDTIGDYKLEQLLGQGGAGRVFAARHVHSGELWALKLLDCHKPAALLRFKREYRVLANVEHDNLVRLGELRVLSSTRAYLTMELINGRPFVEWVRRGTPVGSLPNLVRLRRAMRQLTLGVERLHQEGGIHRDLKPSNVLVAEDGRVVILDFGLIREAGPVGQSLTDAGQALGTPLYMAPEQAGDGEVGPAADWYAVGIMLFECLTGLRPFVGSAMQILLAKQQQGAPDPSATLPEMPESLRTLCMSLLERQPDRRAGAQQLHEQFGEREAETSANLRDGSTFVGRERELARMRSSLERVRHERTAAILRISGPAGIGKSALIQRFIREVEGEEGALVLRCRCVERESLPFKGVDGLVDALALALRRMPEVEAAALQPRQLGPLSRIFPALADAWSSRAMVPEFEPRELRRLGVAALREVLERLADRRLLVLVIDDFQWADTDSARLLVELLRPPAPPAVMLMIGHRVLADGNGAGAALEQLVRAPALVGQPNEHLEVGPLSDDQAEQLARALLADPEDQSVRELVERAGGNPLLLTQLARSELTPGLEGGSERVLMGRLLELPRSGRLVLEYIAVASGPLALSLLERLMPAGTLGADGLTHTLDDLAHTGLIRRESSPTEMFVDASHERIRELVAAELTPAELRGHHRALAEAFEARGAEPEALAEHWEHAGERERALHWAEQAARSAAAHLAFARSVAAYRRALRLIESPGASMSTPGILSGELSLASARLADGLRAELAEQLVAHGETGEAADILLSLAERVPSERATALRRRATRLCFASGRFREAMQLSAEQLASLGESLPRSWLGALAMLIQNRAWILLHRPTPTPANTAAIEPGLLARLTMLQSYVAAGFIISTQPSLQAAAQRARLRRLALEAGEPNHIAYAIALEARIIAWLGDTERAKALLEHIPALPATDDPERDPTLPPLVRYTEASAHFGALAWSAALERIAELSRMVEDEVPGTGWLRPHLLALRGPVRVMSGRILELRASITTDLAAMVPFNDAFNGALVVWASVYVDLFDGNLDRAAGSLVKFREQYDVTYAARAAWLTMAEADVALFRGHLPEAVALSSKLLAQARQHRLDRVRLMFCYFGEQQARALAQLLIAEPTYGDARKQLKRWIRRFRRGREPLLRALASTYRALLNELDGVPAAAQRCWEAALRDYEAADTPARSAAVRLRLASYSPDDRSLVDASLAYFEQQQLGGWKRFVELFAPSVRPLPQLPPR